MARPRIHVATCDKHPRLHPRNAPLLDALAREGVEALETTWTDPVTDWGAADGVLICQTWDYTTQRDRFLAWVDAVAAKTRLWNDARLIAWNSDKGYLRDLEGQGAPTIPTVWLPRGTRADFAEILQKMGWTEAVVKPVVGAAARDTIRASLAEAAPAQAHLERVLASEAVMIQPFLQGVTTRGEVSLLFFDGAYSHAVRKVPREGDYRAHFFFGADTTATTPTQAEMEAAERILAATPGKPLYARVDLVPDDAGRPFLMELEILEPILYLDADPQAADRLARALARRLRA